MTMEAGLGVIQLTARDAKERQPPPGTRKRHALEREAANAAEPKNINLFLKAAASQRRSSESSRTTKGSWEEGAVGIRGVAFLSLAGSPEPPIDGRIRAGSGWWPLSLCRVLEPWPGEK